MFTTPRTSTIALFALLPVLALGSVAARAACPPHAFSQPQQVRVAGDSLMIVTHASSNDDGRFASKLGVDEAIHFAKSKRIPVVYLQDDRPMQNYFMDDCVPDHWVYSEDGGIAFDVPAHLYSVGGHLEECLSRTLNDTLHNWSQKQRRNLTVTLFMDAIFSNGKRIEESDPYNNDFLRFMSIATYARPAGEHYRKLTLLETLGVIIDDNRQNEYLARVLPRFDRTLPDHRVELKLNNSRVRVLQPGRGSRPPVLRFEFIDSAADLNAGFPVNSL